MGMMEMIVMVRVEVMVIAIAIATAMKMVMAIVAANQQVAAVVVAAVTVRAATNRSRIQNLSPDRASPGCMYVCMYVSLFNMCENKNELQVHFHASGVKVSRF